MQQWFFSHRVHWYCFSPVWVNICRSRLLFRGDAALHRMHWYGFSPVWVIICLSRLLFIENVFSHRVHWYGFFPVWVIICWFRLLIHENAFSWGSHTQPTFSKNKFTLKKTNILIGQSVSDWPMRIFVFLRVNLFLLKVGCVWDPRHTGCTDMVSPQYESSYVYQEYSYVKMLSHTRYIYMFFSPKWAFISWSRYPLANSIGDIEKPLEILE